MPTTCSPKLKSNKDPSWFGSPVIASSLCLQMFYTFFLSFQFCLNLSFCSVPHFFLFAEGNNSTVKCAHNALSKKSILSLKHCQKNYFAFAVSWHNRRTGWAEWILASQRRGAPGGGTSAHRPAGRPAQRLPRPTSLSVDFLRAPSQGLAVKVPSPAPWPVSPKYPLIFKL